MDRKKMQTLLEKVERGDLTVPQAMQEMKFLPYQDLGFARIDHHRGIRQGVAEVIFGEGKSASQISQIITQLKKQKGRILVTRVDAKKAKTVRKFHPDLEYHAQARVLSSRLRPRSKTGTKRRISGGFVLVVCAGTSDIPVAEEAAVTAEALGSRVERLCDVGVAGVHRLLDEKEMLVRARVIIVVAGMEGALASLVGGLVDQPVIAVPTSTGYGANFGGLATLLSMLNSCVAGIAVVNIDNGFGAGYLANRIERLVAGPGDRSGNE